MNVSAKATLFYPTGKTNLTTKMQCLVKVANFLHLIDHFCMFVFYRQSYLFLKPPKLF